MKWTKSEHKILTEYYSSTGKDRLIELLPNRTYEAIKINASKLKLSKNNSPLLKGDISVLLEDLYETYYWIGFIMADGSINHDKNLLKVNLSVNDYSHLIKLANYLKMETPHIYNNKTEIKVMDNFLMPRLIKKFDFKPSKTYNPPDLNNLNMKDDFFYCFLIGFIDGDGSIIKKKDIEEYRISIRLHKNWYDNLEFFHAKISNLLNIKVKGLYKYDVSMLVFSDFRILKFLKAKSIEYNLPVLSRKWDKIDLNRLIKGK